MTAWQATLKYEKGLKNVARKMGCAPDICDDLFQTFLVKMYLSESVENKSTFSFLKFCFRNMVISHFSQKNRQNYLPIEDFVNILEFDNVELKEKEELEENRRILKNILKWYKKTYPASKKSHKILKNLAVGKSLKEISNLDKKSYDCISAQFVRSKKAIRKVGYEFFT